FSGFLAAGFSHKWVDY
ncbi:hypothetical protein, partial [Salmonella enterica]